MSDQVTAVFSKCQWLFITSTRGAQGPCALFRFVSLCGSPAPCLPGHVELGILSRSCFPAFSLLGVPTPTPHYEPPLTHIPPPPPPPSSPEMSLLILKTWLQFRSPEKPPHVAGASLTSVPSADCTTSPSAGSCFSNRLSFLRARDIFLRFFFLV